MIGSAPPPHVLKWVAIELVYKITAGSKALQKVTDSKPVSIILQTDIMAPLGEWGFMLHIYNGSIQEVRGLGGITQPEDSVGVLLEDPSFLRCREFLGMHYTAVMLRLSANEDTEIRIEGAKVGETIRLADIGRSATRISTAEQGGVFVSLYDPDISGEFSISRDTVHVGESVELSVEYKVGESGIEQGGGLRLMTPYSSWSDAVLSENDVVLQSAESAKLDVNLIRYAYPMFGHIYAIIVSEGCLVKGDVIRIKYHGPDGGVRAQTYPKEQVHFPALLDARGDGMYYPLSYSIVPAVKVVPGGANRVRIAVPMIVKNGKPFDVRALILDEHYNPVIEPYTHPLTLRLERDDKTIREMSCNAQDGRFIFTGLVPDHPGMYVITVSGPGLQDRQQVIKCTADESELSLYWGAIHGHTDVSDGEFDPDDYYRYGRDSGLLDFCCLADHDWEIVEHERNRKRGGFTYLQELAQKHNDPGRFVTFSAYEWMGPDGHVNVYYNNDRTDNPIYVGDVSVLQWQKAQTLAGLIDLYQGRDDVILIPHSSHGQLWRSHDDALMPVVEMYSCWGCSEYKLGHIGSGAQEGLKHGYRFGFIGGADSHHGSPGHTGSPSKYHILSCREGFAAVYAPELTRDAIFNSLQSRHCYATTAERMLLEFEINGKHMGEELRIGVESRLSIKATAGGTAPIEKLELIHNGEVIHSATGSSLIETYSHEETAREGYYYLRVTQADGEMAWSSPVWVVVG